MIEEEDLLLAGTREARPDDRVRAFTRDHLDRDAQFAHINAAAERYLAAGAPVISLDAKKKELVGDFKNNGREWQPKGQPEEGGSQDEPGDDDERLQRPGPDAEGLHQPGGGVRGHDHREPRDPDGRLGERRPAQGAPVGRRPGDLLLREPGARIGGVAAVEVQITADRRFDAMNSSVM